MKRTEDVELTVLCLIRRNDEYLLQDRIKKDWRGFTLPGGHVEPGESIVDAVIREMQEDTLCFYLWRISSPERSFPRRKVPCTG